MIADCPLNESSKETKKHKYSQKPSTTFGIVVSSPSNATIERLPLMNTRTWILLLALLHLLLATGYAFVTPYRTAGIIAVSQTKANDIGAPDERQHANYIDYLLRERSFPVFSPHDPNLYETYQSHQPPLYYLAAAGWSSLVQGSEPTLPSAGFLLRFFNCIVGAVAIVGVSCLAYWTTNNKVTAVIAAGFAALLPMNLALSGAVSNDPMLIALGTWCLAFCASLARHGWSIKKALFIILLASCAILTKTTAIALLPVVLLTLLISDRSIPIQTRLTRCVAVCGAIVLIALPWWLRNQRLYGDPFAIKAFNQAFVGSMQAERMTEIAGGVLNYWIQKVGLGTMCSFFGVFGYWDIWLPLQVYVIMVLTFAGMAIGWVLYLKTDPDSHIAHWINGAFLLLIVASFIRFNMQYFQAQGRYLLPAIGPLAVGLGCGMTYLSRNRVKVVALSLGILMVGLNFFILSTLPHAFANRIAAAQSAVK
jgi:4-amino-4-deoxy-L-arabinose transferase-like glycosyltransferase